MEALLPTGGDHVGSELSANPPQVSWQGGPLCLQAELRERELEQPLGRVQPPRGNPQKPLPPFFVLLRSSLEIWTPITL